MSDLVESVAEHFDGYDMETAGWLNMSELHRNTKRLAVQRIIEGIEKAGYRIVPVEPTPEMENAADNCLRYCEECKEGTSHPVVIWPAMLAAAPKVI